MGMSQVADPTPPPGAATPAGQTPISPVAMADLWQLRTDPARLDEAAQAWRGLANGAAAGAQTIGTGADAVLGNGWAGDSAETYDLHRRRLVADLRELSQLATRGGKILDDIADALSTIQGVLHEQWYALVATVPATRSDDGTVTFSPNNDEQASAVTNAAAMAREQRSELDSTLAAKAAALERVRADLDLVARAWTAVASGAAQPFAVPAEPTGSAVILDGDRMIVHTGAGDETVAVLRDPFTGRLMVVIYGPVVFGEPLVLARYPVPEGVELTIRAGGGDDTIIVPEGMRVALTILGGDGDDEIRAGAGDDVVLAGDGDDLVGSGGGDDRISGGAGHDYLSGREGEDRLAGGSGVDTIYGGAGGDRLSGGDGDDYLDGGRGADTLDGGRGDDVLSGGGGDDVLSGRAGADTIYTGRGSDTVSGGSDSGGGDVVYGQLHPDGRSLLGLPFGEEPADAIDGAERVVHVDVTEVRGATIRLEGSDEFTQRVRDDLETLNSSPRGRLMLRELDEVPNEPPWGTLTIVESTEPSADMRLRPGIIDTYRINYNPEWDDFRDATPPPVVLYHEMAHVFDYDNGTNLDGNYDGPDAVDTGVNNTERQATGLPVDRDGDGDEEVDPLHPEGYTENGLRREMRLPARETYRDASQSGGGSW